MRQFAAILTVFAAAAPLMAQFSNLSTNHDGSVLYFSSTLPAAGVPLETHPKLFIADREGVRLLLQRPRLVLPNPSGWPLTTYYSVESAAVSGDGRVLAVTAQRGCLGGSGCLPVTKYETQVSVDGVESRSIIGRVSLSHNGRYALSCCNGSLVSPSYLLDRETGESREVQPSLRLMAPAGRRSVSSTGIAAVPRSTESGTELVFMGLSSERVIATRQAVSYCVLDEAARTALCETGGPYAPGAPRGLVRIDVEAGTEEILAVSSPSPQPALSADGRRVLYLARDERNLVQLYALDGPATQGRPLLRETASVTNFALSDNGEVAYAVTAAGRLLRLHVESGVIEEVIGRTVEFEPWYPSTSPPLVPGSLYRLEGRGFADELHTAGTPAPSTLAGTRVLIDGRPVPLLSVSAAEITFQVPWGEQPGARSLAIEVGADTPFRKETVLEATSQTNYPRFERLGPEQQPSVRGERFARATHADTGALVTREQPMRPGETIHLTMTGLGAVDGPVPEDGHAAPLDTELTVRSPVGCKVYPDREVRTLFAGLVPGQVGLYRVTIQLPENVAATENGELTLSCVQDEIWSLSAPLPVEAPRPEQAL